MSAQASKSPEVAVQLEEVVKKYSDIRKNTDEEIAKIKKQLSELGVSGSTLVKLKPLWLNDVDYLITKGA